MDRGVNAEPSIVHQNIEGSEVLDGGGDKDGAGVRVGDIRRVGEGIVPELCSEAPQALLAAGSEDYIAASSVEQACRCLPDAG